MTIISAQITIQRQPDSACIYGLFDNGKCIYVGRTRNPIQRMVQHTGRFYRERGRLIEKRIFKIVPRSEMHQAEREMIQFYAGRGEAELNRNSREKIIENSSGQA